MAPDDRNPITGLKLNRALIAHSNKSRREQSQDAIAAQGGDHRLQFLPTSFSLSLTSNTVQGGYSNLRPHFRCPGTKTEATGGRK